MVAKDIRWIRLLDPENHNISWANHISHTNPGKRDKSDPSFKRQWSRLFHCAALVRSADLVLNDSTGTERGTVLDNWRRAATLGQGSGLSVRMGARPQDGH